MTSPCQDGAKITPKLKIPVETYAKTKAIIRAAKKASKKHQQIHREGSAGIDLQSNQDVNEQILPEDIIDGIQFGGSLVAVSKDDKASLELNQTKVFKS